jgi:hypothetical protein
MRCSVAAIITTCSFYEVARAWFSLRKDQLAIIFAMMKENGSSQ